MAEPTPSSVYDLVPLPLGETTCIRIIKIRPSKTHDCSDTIVCDFAILDVDKGKLLNQDVATTHRDRDLLSGLDRMWNLRPSGIEYRALSYTWGTLPADHEIELHGSKFKVRTNLWNFLDRARRNCFEKYIWIDALCINQSKVQERNHQVSMMGTIYSKAACVIVWLGICHEMDLNNMFQITFAFNKQGPKGLGRLSHQQMRTILKFYNNPYWRRAWIVQEYVLAKSIDIWFGRHQIQPGILSQMFQKSDQDGFADMILQSAAMKIVRLRATGVLAPDGQKSRRHRNFLHLVSVFGQGLKCADPRDRVYALLSLLSHTERQELDIHPDYSRSPTELYVSILGKMHDVAFGDTHEHFLLLDRLKSMLDPVSRDRAVQLATLDLRAAWQNRGYDFGPLFGINDHRCARISNYYPTQHKVGIDGCRNCSLVPTIEVHVSPWSESGFSLPQWMQWVRALMNSHQVNDRLLGRRIAQDMRMILAPPARQFR